MRTNLIILIIPIFISIILISGCVDNAENNDNESYYEELTIEISADEGTNYYLLIPAIINNQEEVLEFQNTTLEIGKPSITLQQTPYGKAHNISGQGHIQIKMKNHIEPMYEDFFSYSLSLLNQTEEVNGYFSFFYYIHTDSSDVIINFNFIAESKYSQRNIYFQIETPSIEKWSTGEGVAEGESD